MGVQDEAFRPIREAMERLGVQAVFGEPQREGDTLVIPVADTAMGFGYGFGPGQEADSAGEGAHAGAATAMSDTGAGGGGGGAARAKGYIKISPQGVSYEPFIDITLLGIAGILMVAWNVFWITWTVRAFARRR